MMIAQQESYRYYRDNAEHYGRQITEFLIAANRQSGVPPVGVLHNRVRLSELYHEMAVAAAREAAHWGRLYLMQTALVPGLYP